MVSQEKFTVRMGEDHAVFNEKLESAQEDGGLADEERKKDQA